jgi:hypothetical protein
MGTNPGTEILGFYTFQAGINPATTKIEKFSG